MRYVVIGAGAIGGTVGAYMIRAGHDVLFVDVDADHVKAINERGLTIRGYGGTFTVKAEAITPAELQGPLDVVLLATKAQATATAVASIEGLLAPDGCVVSLQNGLNEITISRMIGPERTVGCFVNFSADYVEPGLVHYGGPGAFYIGELDGTITTRLKALQDVLSAWGSVQMTDNIFGYLWGKQGYGAMLFATSLTNESMGDCIDQNRKLMVAIAREVLSVAKQLGVQVKGFDGYDPDLYMSGDEAAINASLDRLVAIRARDEKKHAGIWRDLVIRKRKTEVDQQPGMVLAEGERLGLKLPLLMGIVRMIHEVEDERRELSTENLVELAREGGLA
jgi:2-dehydropantoate 2-reductase